MMETIKALHMSVPYGVVIGGLGEYADEYLLPIFIASGYQIWITRGAATLYDTLSRQIDLRWSVFQISRISIRFLHCSNNGRESSC